MNIETRRTARLTASPAAAVFAALLGSFALAVIATALDGFPLPRAFDEFSYVLAGETFASGRLTNAQYAFPEAVETIHVINRPSYSSKYLPGHGLFLALGTVLGGGPRLGQWIAFAAMGGAVFWLLSALFSQRAAFLTSGLFVLLLADTEWASGYWGSSVAVAGSALVFGSIVRLRDGPRVRLGVLLGLGVVALALTRPLEGLAVCVAPAAYMLVWLLRARERRRRLVHVALPCALVLALGGALLAAHNAAVTGNAARLAYAHYEKDTPGAPPFIWQRVNAARDSLRANERARLNIDLGSYRGMRDDWLVAMWARATAQSLPYYFPHAVFALVFLLVPFALRDRRLWLLAASTAAVGAATAVSSFFLPHYIGPAVPPLLVLYAAGCGLLARLTWSRVRFGYAAVVALCIVLTALGTWRLVDQTPLERAMTRSAHWTRQRDAIAHAVSTHPGKHVVFVRYDGSYESQNEWVQNGADLTRTPVLWVHDRGDSANAALRQHEAERTAWLLTVYGGPHKPGLARYNGSNLITLNAATGETGR